jgi:hypothetical protein
MASKENRNISWSNYTRDTTYRHTGSCCTSTLYPSRIIGARARVSRAAFGQGVPGEEARKSSKSLGELRFEIIVDNGHAADRMPAEARAGDENVSSSKQSHMRRGRTQAYENGCGAHITGRQSRERQGAVRSLTLAALFRQRLTRHFRSRRRQTRRLAPH